MPPKETSLKEIEKSRQPFLDQHEYDLAIQRPQRRSIATSRWTAVLLVLIFTLLAFFWSSYPSLSGRTCQDPISGYICRPDISRLWGQYSPYFEIESEIPNEVPAECKISFAQVLSRHGARDPTTHKTVKYHDTISKLQANVKNFRGKYSFLNKYKYNLGADQLNVFGTKQMVYSGMNFYKRYQHLCTNSLPFVRASGQQRVIDSATNWTLGFKQAKSADGSSGDQLPDPYEILVISEDTLQNNTLDNTGLCPAFDESDTADKAKVEWASIFVPRIQDRFNNEMLGANLTEDDVLIMMQMCPFDTVAHPRGHVSPFCNLLTENEWREYNQYESVEKYYRYGKGNALGPTLGVGFANELIARMTRSPVRLGGMINSTLDTDPATFPLDKEHMLFADFSHDNELTAAFFALNLYNATPPLHNTTVDDIEYTKGWSSAWTVPFAGRAYFEKMQCDGEDDELVRVIVNNRVLPLERCGGDNLGRCKLKNFIDSMSFARHGGRWDKCFD